MTSTENRRRNDARKMNLRGAAGRAVRRVAAWAQERALTPAALRVRFRDAAAALDRWTVNTFNPVYPHRASS
ncbi:hypothetical protein GCM10012275_03330 [Longimycelium tulufanense]|uniref:Uncharacterized protein n=1 Tax=Longimycelium tulufanense TaxID=907463 RepID=A0A8J3CA37_9PSEU|nr:hypothetical protein [Longimycelium tulufanense]GGM35395.1 hypothetical protein GCM10012275_03330 [Longimycelium tulufanense]